MTNQKSSTINTYAPFLRDSQQFLLAMEFDSIKPRKQSGDCDSASSCDKMATAAAGASQHVITMVEQMTPAAKPSQRLPVRKRTQSPREILRSRNMALRPPTNTPQPQQLHDSSSHGLVAATVAAVGRAATGKTNQAVTKVPLLASNRSVVGARVRDMRTGVKKLLDLSHSLDLHMRGLSLTMERWPSKNHDVDSSSDSN